MKRKALYPGSFDPITLGHTDVIDRCISLFGEFYIAVGTNTSKSYLYSQEERIKMVKAVYSGNDRVKVVGFNGLTVDVCKELDCQILVRGLRSTTDMEYERAIAHSNNKLSSDIETILLLSSPSVSSISSTIVRELIRNKADVHDFVPARILSML